METFLADKAAVHRFPTADVHWPRVHLQPSSQTVFITTVPNNIYNMQASPKSVSSGCQWETHGFLKLDNLRKVLIKGLYKAVHTV